MILGESAYVGRGWSETHKDWSSVVPPQTGFEAFKISAEAAWKSGLTYGLYDKLFTRGQEIARIEQEDPRTKEIISPEILALDYPNTTVPIRNPMTRSEAQVLEQRDMEMQELQSLLGGRVVSMFPDWIASPVSRMGGALGGSVVDPIGLALGFGSIGLLSKVPAVHKLATMSSVAKSAWHKRGYAGMVLAMDGLLQQSMYSSLNMGVSLSDYKPYKWTDMMEELAYGTIIGSGLGLAFPGIAKFQTDVGAGTIAYMDGLRRAMSRPGGRNTFSRYLRDEGGAIDFGSLGDFLMGRGKSPRKNIKNALVEDKVTHGSVKEVIRKPSRASMHSFLTEPMHANRKFYGMAMRETGVAGIYGRAFPRVRPFYRAGFSGSGVKKSASFSRQGGPALGVQFDTLYFNVPDLSGGGHSFSSLALKDLHLSTEPRGAALEHMMGVQKGNLPSLKNVKVMGVKLSTGSSRSKKTAVFLDLDAEGKLLGVRNPLKKQDQVPYQTLSDIDKAKAIKKGLSNKRYDGVKYTDEDGLEHVLLSKKAWHKMEAFSDEFLEYRLPGDETIGTDDIRTFMDTLDGKTEASAPPSVNSVLEEYFHGYNPPEGEGFYSKFLRRIHPQEISYYPSVSPVSAIRAGGKSFDATWDFSRLSPKVHGDIVGALEEMKIPATALTPRIRNLEELVDKVLENDFERVSTYMGLLRKKGFKFPSVVDANWPDGKWFFLNDRVIPPIAPGDTVMSAILRNENPNFHDVKIMIPPRPLRLDVTPLHMVEEEIEVLKRLVESDSIFSEDSVKRSLTLQGKGISTLTSYLSTPKFSKALQDMGFNKVMYRTPEGLQTVELGKGRTFVKGRTILKSQEKLQEKIAPPDQLVKSADVRGDERRKAYMAYLDGVAGQGPVQGTLRIGAQIEQMVGSPDQREKVKRLIDNYVQIVDKAKRMGVGSATYRELNSQALVYQEDIGKVFRVLNWVKDGGLEINLKSKRGKLENVFRYMEGEEFLNLFKYMPDMPFETIGGETILGTQSHLERTFTVGFLRKLEETIGIENLDLFKKGHLDDQLYKVEAYMLQEANKEGSRAGLSGGSVWEKVGVSKTSWDIYEAIRETLDVSQKHLVDSGIMRRPRKGYMGIISYDSRKVLRTTKKEFIDDLIEHVEFWRKDKTFETDADAKMAMAEDIYLSFTETTGRSLDRTGMEVDIQKALESHRLLDFKTPKNKIAFLDKYGKRPRPGTERAKSYYNLSMPTGSNVFAGVLESINTDSRLAAVSGWFGTRPFLTLDLAMSSLEHKYSDILDSMGKQNTVWKNSFMAGVRNSKAHGERVLDMLVFGASESYGNLATVRKALLSAVSLKLLPFVSITAGFGDLISSSAHFFKMTGKNPFKTSMDLIGERFKKLSYEDRRLAARSGYQILISDIQDYTRRVYNSDAAGVGSWLENVMMRTTGLPYITDVGMSSNTTYMGIQMGGIFKLPWSQLTDSFKGHLKTHGIIPESWEWVRKQDIFRSVEGVPHVYPDYIDNALRNGVATNQITEETADAWFRQYNTLYNGLISEKTIPVQGIYENAFFNVDAKNPDSYLHNLAKLFSQFKAIAVTAFRSLIDAGAGKTLGRKRDLFHANFGKIMALSTFYGGTTIILGDIARGRGFNRDVGSVDFLGNAALRGGTFGILGDFLFGAHNNYFGGWAGGVLGPTATPLFYSSQVLKNLLLLEGGELPDSAGNLLESVTPAITPLHPILLNTVFSDTLGNIN